MDFDSIMDLYNYTKRDKGNSIYYDADKDEVYSSKSGLEGIVLINDTNCLCNTVIKQYLDALLPHAVEVVHRLGLKIGVGRLRNLNPYKRRIKFLFLNPLKNTLNKLGVVEIHS